MMTIMIDKIVTIIELTKLNIIKKNYYFLVCIYNASNQQRRIRKMQN